MKRNPFLNQNLFTESDMSKLNQKSFLEEDNYMLESPQIIILGIFGHNNKVSETDLQENTLNLILQELGRLPDKVLIPSEGNTSIYIQEWAESLKIEHQVFQADFRKHNKLAWILRDDRIQKECTHGLYFLSQKSDKGKGLELWLNQTLKC